MFDTLAAADSSHIHIIPAHCAERGPESGGGPSQGPAPRLAAEPPGLPIIHLHLFLFITVERVRSQRIRTLFNRCETTHTHPEESRP